MRSRAAHSTSTLLANPYVVLVDLLIATFFVMVLYIHKVRLDNLAAIDPHTAMLLKFESELKRDVEAAWKNRFQDESLSSQGRTSGGGELKQREEEWWETIPSNTRVIVKQDSSLLRIIPWGPDDANALFHSGSPQPLPACEDFIDRLSRCLAQSQSAHNLTAFPRSAIATISVVGFAAGDENSPNIDPWELSVDRALEVRKELEQSGERYEAKFYPKLPDSKKLFLGRFSVVAHANSQGLPYRSESFPGNRRVVIEIQFTNRYED